MRQGSVFVTRRLPTPVEKRLIGEVSTVEFNREDRPLSRPEMFDVLRAHDVVLTNVADRIDDTLLQGQIRTRLIANYGVGYSNIDTEAAAQRAIAVSNTPDVLTEPTAETAIMLMLMVARRAGEAERELRAGRWAGWRPTHMLGAPVIGQVLGLFGLGRIGQEVARRAHFGLDMPVVCFAPTVDRSSVPEWVELLPTPEAVLERADVVSLHIPGGVQNRHFLDADRLAVMKQSAFLVNTARGDVVDEGALVEALRDGRIAGAGLDVFEDEPAVHPGLLALESVVLLPHIGSATAKARTAMGMLAIDNICAFLDGHEMPSRVV